MIAIQLSGSLAAYQERIVAGRLRYAFGVASGESLLA
jgi:hypothetical protein